MLLFAILLYIYMLYTAYIIFFVKNFGYSLEYPCIHARPGPLVPPWERIPTKQQLVLPQWRTRTLCNLQCRIGITGPPKHPEKPCYICMEPMMLSTLGGSIHVHAHACLPQGSQSSIIFPSACYFCQRFLATFAFMMQSNGSEIWVGSPAFLHGRIVSTRYSAVAIIDW